ncbi:hypothetical protein RHK41_19790 [Clostridioides difficile]|nr:hypothetical protein [Clostridioides difficile]
MKREVTMNLNDKKNSKIKNKENTKVLLLVLLLCIFILIGLAISIRILNKDSYMLDYKLEQTISNSIEANNSVNLADVVNIDFDKVCVYYSYAMFKLGKGEVGNIKEISKNNFSYVVFLDKDKKVIKSLLLNKKYDILGNLSYMEYPKNNSILTFKKIKVTNEYTYKLEKIF